MRRSILAAAVAFFAVFGGACGSDVTDESDQSVGGGAAEAESADEKRADPAGDLVGPGCANYIKQVPSGAGSVNGMAEDPVAIAAGNNPLLKTLVQAVSGKLNPKVNLVDTLNGDEFTVFAPINEAFTKVDQTTLQDLKTDDVLLTKVLTYHLLPGRVAPDDIMGKQTTVQGDTVNITGSGDNLRVNGARVVCGGVTTANATVYLIDSVLMPTM